jgi:uncharacterized protein (TIGR03437 family)
MCRIHAVIIRILLFAAFVVGGNCLAQNTIRVPADKATIQAGILSAASGDTVLVSPGMYRERIDFSGKAITVRSLSGPDVTTIDGGQAGVVVSFISRETASSVLQGFTIQNGTGNSSGPAEGGGITVEGSSPTILGNRIINNSACYNGGGIGIGGGSPLIQNNFISNNNNCAGLGGGGIGVRGGDGTRILNNTISGNTTSSDGGGVVLWAGGSVTLRGNIITGNSASGTGGGIATVNSAPATIVDNLIVGNKASGAGALSFSNPPLALINNTIADNRSTNTTASAISGIQTSFNSQLRIVGNLIIAVIGQLAVGCGTYGTSAITGTFANNDVFAPGGFAYNTNCVDQTAANGNISADPRFLNAAGGNYRLQSASPAVNAGDPVAPELTATDLDGNPRKRIGKVDMGAFEYPGPASVTVSPTSLTFSQQAVGASSEVQSLTITNTASVALQIASIAIVGDFVQTNTCSAAAGVAPGASCIVAATFNPSSRGTRTGTLTIVSNATGSPSVISLAGTAVGAVMSLSTTSLSFPNQLVNADSNSLPVTITNVGDYPLTVTGVTTSAEFAQTNICTAAVATGSSCVISVVFHPLGSGTRTGTVTIAGNAVGGSQVVNVAGNGQAPAPLLSSVSPNTAVTGGSAFGLTVLGSNFILNSVVRWNGSDRPTTFVSPNQLTAAIASGDLAAGAAVPVTVFNPAPSGGSSNPLIVAVNNRVPALTSISPASALVGGANFQLTVSGAGFVTGSVVRWNGNDRNTAFVNAGQLRADITATDISFASTSQVTVFNPAPGGGLSGSLTFTALTPTPLPSVSGIAPSSATAGDPAFSLTITGNGFVPTSVVQWNRAARTTTFVSDSQLTAFIPATDLATGGFPSITVFNPAPGGGTSAGAVFTVAGNPLPFIISVAPSGVIGGGRSLMLSINGGGFSANSVVQWNGVSRPSTFVSATQLTAMLFAGDTAVTGTGKVTVFNPPPGGGTSQALALTVSANPLPAISGLLPATLVAGSPGQSLQVLGSGFTASSVVRWNGQDRATTLVDSGTLRISVTASEFSVPGLSEVRVFNPPIGGGASSPVSFATTIGIPASGMVYDSTRGVLWASVPGSQPKLGNSVVSIDPATGKAGTPIFVGSEPGKVVISDDGQYLYVALKGTAAVRRVDLVAQTADLQFPVGSDGFFGAVYVDDMAVMPGQSHTVAISRMYSGVSPRHAGVGIYDDGVIRKNLTQVHTGSDRIEFSSSPTTIYGFNNETTEFGFRILTVDANGVKETKSYGGSPIGGFGADIRYIGGRIYGTSGAVLNPDTGSLIGKFTFPLVNGSIPNGYGLTADFDLGRAFFVTAPFGASPSTLSVFDNSTFTPVGTLNIPGLTTGYTADDAVVRWGDSGLAIRGTGQIFVISSPLVKPPAITPADFVVAASYAPGALVPGSIASLFRSGLTPLSLAATGIPLPTSLSGIALSMNDIPVPLYYAAPGQINFQVPWELSGKPSADVTVGLPGFFEKSVTVLLVDSSPAIFTTGAPDGQAIAVLAGTTQIAGPVGALPGAAPVQRGDFLTLYCNGLGSVANQPLTGSAGPSDNFATTKATPIVTIGGASAKVLYSGLAPGLVGIYQVNVQVPDSSSTGDAVPVVISLPQTTSNTATIAVR